MVKKILFSLLAIFLTYRTSDLLKISERIAPDQLSWLGAMALAFVINLFVTGIFAFPGFVFPTGQLLPRAYYQVRNPQMLDRVYRLWGVHYFRKMLLFGFWGKDKNRKKYFNGTKKGIPQFDYQTRQSEFGHLGAAVVIFFLSFVILAHGHVESFAYIHLFNVIGNFYPVVLQRKHRSAIQRLRPRR